MIRQNSAYAYHLLSFTASKTATTVATTSSTGSATAPIKQVQIVWTTENEQNYTNFTVERSTDAGKTYEVVGSVSGNAQGTYSLMDRNPAEQNLYRLKQEDINNSITYSKIVPIGYSAINNNLDNNSINIYPNPTSINISLTIIPKTTGNATYHIRVTNGTGFVVKSAIVTEPYWQSNVSGLLTGTYLVQVIDIKNNSVIGQTKFVKL